MKKRISTKRNDKMEPNRILELKIKKKFYLGFKRKFVQSEERISKLEESLLNIKSEGRNLKKKNEELLNSLRNIYETIKRTDTFSMGVPEGEESAKGAQSLFEAIMHKNVPNSRKEMHIRIQ